MMKNKSNSIYSRHKKYGNSQQLIVVHGKTMECHLGMLLPSKASLAAEEVGTSVYWINACQRIR
jgi:hypothetical protein